MLKTCRFNSLNFDACLHLSEKYIMLVLPHPYSPQYIEIVVQICSYSKQFSEDEERNCTFTQEFLFQS